MAGRLRILTANLWNGRADPDALARLVEEEAVDVACLQELTAEQADAVATVLPYGSLEPARDFTGMGIALRRPAQIEQLPLRYRPVRAASLSPCDWPGLAEPLAVWNAHVRAPHDWPPPASLVTRRHQLRGLLGHLEERSHPRLVLVGDFNATPVWPVYRQVAARLRDAACEVAERRGERPARTWKPWAGADGPRVLRIDHAFVHGVEIEDLRRLHVAGSDHDALCVDVTLG